MDQQAVGRERAIAPGAVTVIRAFVLMEKGGVRRHLRPGEVISTIASGSLPGLLKGGYVQSHDAVSEPVAEPARAKKVGK